MPDTGARKNKITGLCEQHFKAPHADTKYVVNMNELPEQLY